MYGRIDPKSISTIDLSFFHGAYLSQVCLGAHDLGLNFDKPAIRIMAQSSFRMLVGDNISIHQNEEGYRLRPFLNKDVVLAKWAEMGTLILTFEGGDEIHLLDDSDQYESYNIGHAGLAIIM